MQQLPKPLTEQIRGYALLGATDLDICELLDMSEAQLAEEFGDMLVQARAQRRISLRRKQTAVAIEGNSSMLSLLGKHELGQTQTFAAADNDWPEPQLDPKVG
jgi:hypothetical protein